MCILSTVSKKGVVGENRKFKNTLHKNSNNSVPSNNIVMIQNKEKESFRKYLYA